MIQNNILNAMDTCVRLTNESSAANNVVKKWTKYLVITNILLLSLSLSLSLSANI